MDKQNTPDRVSQAAFARLLGVSKARITQLKQTGLPLGGDGLIDVGAAKGWIAANVNRQHGGWGTGMRKEKRSTKAPAKKSAARAKAKTADAETPRPGQKPSRSYIDERARSERVKADILEMEFAKRQGELVELAEVNAFVAGMILNCREQFLRVGPELRDVLAQQSDPIRCEEAVTDRIVRILKNLSEFKPEGRK